MYGVFTARRYALRGLSHRILSVCPSVCHTRGLDCVHMVRPTVIVSSPYGSSMTLVSAEVQIAGLSQNSKGVTPSEGVE